MFEINKKYINREDELVYVYKGYIKTEGRIGYFHVMKAIGIDELIAERTLIPSDWMVCE